MAAKERRESNAPTNFKRVEEKYRLSHEESRELFARLAERAEVEEFIPGQPVARLTTLYCDGPSLPFFRAAKAGGPKTRARVRIYSSDPPLEQPSCWVEWKTSPPRGESGYTTKQRFRLPQTALGGFFSGALGPEEIRAMQHSKKAGEEAAECSRLFLSAFELHGLHPIAATSYQRRALIIGSDRVTFDLELQYHTARWEEGHLCLAESVADEASIIEVKRTKELPAWTQEHLQRYQAKRAVGFSKFERALELLWPTSSQGQSEAESASQADAR